MVGVFAFQEIVLRFVLGRPYYFKSCFGEWTGMARTVFSWGKLRQPQAVNSPLRTGGYVGSAVEQPHFRPWVSSGYCFLWSAWMLSWLWASFSHDFRNMLQTKDTTAGLRPQSSLPLSPAWYSRLSFLNTQVHVFSSEFTEICFDSSSCLHLQTTPEQQLVWV